MLAISIDADGREKFMKYFEKPLSQHSHLIQLKSNPGFQFPFSVQASHCSALLDLHTPRSKKVVGYLNHERQKGSRAQKIDGSLWANKCMSLQRDGY